MFDIQVWVAYGKGLILCYAGVWKGWSLSRVWCRVNMSVFILILECYPPPDTTMGIHWHAEGNTIAEDNERR